MTGVFISRGMSIGVPSGGSTLAADDGGNIKGSLSLHVWFDVTRTWLELAQSHLGDARERRTSRQAAWAQSDETLKASSLEREFESSMQAVMSAAIALDAYYAVVKNCVTLPANLEALWREKRTPRHSQVTEVIRRAFALKKEGTAALRKNIRQVFHFRDLAVHPSGKIEAPLLHPELNVGVEWRFAYFRAMNAEEIVYAVGRILWDLSNGPAPKSVKLAKYSVGLKAKLNEIFPNGRPIAVRI